MAAAKSATGSGQKDQPIIPPATIVDPNDPHVIEIAQFAVKKYNEEQGTDLAFINAEFGFLWSVQLGGTHNLLAIKTQDNKGTYSDVALVFHVPRSPPAYDLIWYNHKNN